MPKLPLIITAVACLIMGLLLGWLRLRHESAPHEVSVALSAPLDFTLTDHTGATLHLADLRGTPVLCYAGYTFCPDICPTELGYLSRLLKALGPEADRLQPLFISVDPGRDTPTVLADYVRMFHPRLRGLTGTPDQLKSACSTLGVIAERVDPVGAKSGYYLMNHTSTILVIDRDGRVRSHIDSHTPMDEALASIRAVLR
jgi:protein SCO1/2